MEREKVLAKVKQNKAYTLMEMLIVVALTVVLLGISVLGISTIITTMRMTELDRYAQTIYLEAQNQLIAKEVEGGLPSFYNTIETEYAGRFLQVMPQDYEVEENTEEGAPELAEESADAWKQLCFLSKADTEMTAIVYSAADMYEENYIIELNPQTGDVYGVFYWEQEEGVTTDAAYFENYYKNVIQGLSDRERKTRTSVELGYYGGSFVNTTMASDFKLDQKVEVINEEELYVKVSFKGSGMLFTGYGSSLEVAFEIEDEHGNKWEGVVDNANAAISSRLELCLLLDSMESGYDFATITEAYGLVPGDDLTIKVISTFSKGAYYRREESASVVVNSLFDGKSTAGDTTTIQVANLRHLRNLDASVFSEKLMPNGTRISLVPDGKIVIKQTDDIDFATTNFAWKTDEFNHIGYVGAGKAKRPGTVTNWTPLENEKIFDNTAMDITTIDGNDYKLQNFEVVAEFENVGLIAYANYVEFKDIKIEDITIHGESAQNVGALAGAVYNGKVDNCGVYLTTYTEENGKKEYYSQNIDVIGYANEMERRYDTMTVYGDKNVGGLFGNASDCEIFDSYAAVYVRGRENIGGFVGNAKNVTIENCYSSGDVRGTEKAVGGFLGNVTENISVVNAYATGDIYGKGVLGGFLGYSRNSSYTDCFSYGEVLNLMGEAELINAGGFISNAGNAGNSYSNCKYLSQKGYNIQSDFSEPVNIGHLGYSEFVDLAIGAQLTGASYPYKAYLPSESFPFKKVLEHHYGNWPIQYLINNALVYYERYADGWYGYYCVTKITSKEDPDTSDGYIWVLDTLRDTECVEDGYAFLSMYSLEQFDYELHIGSTTNATMSGTLQVSDTYGSENAVMLRQQGGLIFSAYAETDITNAIATTGSGETYQEYDYSNASLNDYIVVSGMYLYQLPYELQSTDRYNVENFYDKLVIDNGYAKGNEETPVVGGESGALSFYYCPHFAKTAINPGLDDEGQYINGTALLDNPTKVFVRSARHLNAMGRYPYYWNKEGGLSTITYMQETDINFGTYTSTYCGHTFDMGIDGNVANHPIGVADYSDTYKQFRNKYDGQCNKIIDYCLYSDQQFSGLFGEIKGATIQNVVMTVSQKGAGKIYATFFDESNDTNNKRAGLGALVGLAYNDENDIINCTASGYEIEYHLTEVPGQMRSGYQQPTGIAVGGLIGFGMSDMNNCTADNDVKFVAKCNYEEGVFLGGLAGSFHYATMRNAYSGGTITVDVDGNDDGVNDYYLKELGIGGVCPGLLYTSCDVSSNGTKYENVYTYTDVADSVWQVPKTAGGSYFENFIPAVGRMGWNGDFYKITSRDFRVPGGNISYYLTTRIQKHLDRIDSNSDVREYFEESGWLIKYGKTCDPATYTVLADLASMPNDDAKHRAVYSYPYAEGMEGLSYPFPAFITDAEGNYVHYGDWPTE